MLQLSPPLPLVIVDSSGWRGPTGKAIAHFVIERGVEHHAVFFVCMDATGEWWLVEHIHVRGDPNYTWGRNTHGAGKRTPGRLN